MEISQFFVKSLFILNEIEYNLKCPEQETEFGLKGDYLTKNSRKI